MQVHIRWMIRRDMPEVLEIENESFEFPWSEEDFIRFMRQRNVVCMAAEYDEQVVGFVMYELHRKRLHVLNFAVWPDLRRQGVGRQMVDKLKTKLSPMRRRHLLIKIRDSNLDAHLFFRRMGFEAIEVLHDSFDDSDEDAYLMDYEIQRELCELGPLEDSEIVAEAE